MQEVWQLTETCSLLKPCAGRELANSKPQKTYRSALVDEKFFLVCGYCNKPMREQLKQCPECGVFFKGPKPYRPFRFQIECEKCE